MVYGSILGGVIYKVCSSLLFGKVYQGTINVIHSVITPSDLVQHTFSVCTNSHEE